MYDLVITNAHVVTMNRRREVLYPGAVAVRGDRIAAVGRAGELAGAQARRVIDARGKAVFPGLVNTHTHLFQSLLKGLGDDRNLADWLFECTLPSLLQLGTVEAYTSSMLGCLDALHSGTTTIVDFNYAHPVEGMADETIRAFRELGIRGILARGGADAGAKYGMKPGTMQDTDWFLSEYRRLYDRYHGADNDRLRVWVAPAAVWNCSEAALRGARRLSRESPGSGYTVHISETPWDRESSADAHGGFSDAAMLEAFDLVGPDVLMVHCVYLTSEEIRMAKRHDLKVSLNAVSNMYLASGIPPVPEMLAVGLTCSIGTDGAASNNTQDMLEALKTTALLIKVGTTDPTALTAPQVLEMATIGGARSIGLDDKIGSLEVGKRADLFIFDPARAARAVPMFDPISTLVYSGGMGNVELVVVDGRVVLEDGEVTAVDEHSFLGQAQRVAEELAERAGTFNARERSGLEPMSGGSGHD